MPKEMHPLIEFYSALSGATKVFVDKNYNRLGTLIIGEFMECRKLPTKSVDLEKLMIEASRILEVTVVQKVFHEFSPYGLSGVLVLAESHFSIHTWPEYNCAAIDMFACGKMHWKEGLSFLAKEFGSSTENFIEIPRGVSLKH
jgi:S-adenosylmethionine decarboxylase